MTGIVRRGWIRSLIFLLPLITLLLFGLSGGWIRAHAWISGAAVACAEAALLIGWLRPGGRGKGHEAAPAPFHIALGFLDVAYLIAVLACVLLLGYVFDISAAAYFTVHLILLAGYAVVAALLRFSGKFAGSQDQKQRDQRNIRNNLLKRLTSMRAHVRGMSATPGQSDLMQELAQLEETIAYGDPAVIAARAGLTGVVEQHLSLLEDQIQLIQAVDDSKKEALTAETVLLVRKMRELFLDRNNLASPFKSNSV